MERVTAAQNLRVEEPTRDGLRSPGAAVAKGTAVSHNLNGQKLGRKGRDTRERILAATVELLAASEDEAVSLSAVARKASLGMTSLYNYFNDFTELLLAVIEPVMAESESAFVGMLRSRWPDEELGERCYAFMTAYYDFWSRHSRLLHLRNAMADNRDDRMIIQRVSGTQPLITLFVEQMDGDIEGDCLYSQGMATVLMTGIERTVTMVTDLSVIKLFGVDQHYDPDYYLRPEARLMEMAIRDTRRRNGAQDTAVR